MPKNGLTKTNDFAQLHAREIDFVSRFTRTWDALRDIMGIMRPIRKQAGTKLTSYKAQMKSDSLQGGTSVGEGEEIPYTEFEVIPVAYNDVQIAKYAKAVSIEAVDKYGATVAIERTDEAFLNELQGKVMTDFYTFLKTGTLTNTQNSFQKALAMARGLVLDKFQSMRKSVTNVVGFCNILDVYKYLGDATITTQTAFGMTYIEDFMGYSTLFLGTGADIPEGIVIALPVENIDLYYIDPSDSDYARLGLTYTVQGETNLIGFHANGDYSHAVGESFAIMGMKLWAEFLDGIAIVDFSTTTKKAITATSAAGTTKGTKLTITAPTTIPADWTFYIASHASTAPTAPDYGAVVDTNTWTKVVFEDGVADNVENVLAKATLIAANGTGQCVAASGSITITNHA